MTNANYCRECGETLSLHADNSIACSCDFLDSDSAVIPAGWELTDEELVDAGIAQTEVTL